MGEGPIAVPRRTCLELEPLGGEEDSLFFFFGIGHGYL